MDAHVVTSNTPALTVLPAPDDALVYLREKGEQVRPAAGREVTMQCPWCPAGHGGAKGRGKLYVNRDSYLFMCQVCGTNGGKKMLMEHYGDEAVAYTGVGTDPGVRTRILTQYASLAADQLLGNEAMMLALLNRGLTAQTIVDYQLGYVPRGMSIAKSLPGEYKFGELKAAGMLTDDGSEFLAGRITIPYLSHGRAMSVRGKDPEGKYVTPFGDEVRLFNADKLHGAEHVIVTEGEFDALMVQQALQASPNITHRQLAVVAVPGTQAMPGGTQHFADYFTDAKRVYLGFDADTAGKTGAMRAKELVGTKARIVELPNITDDEGHDVGLDWTDWLRPMTAQHPHGGHGVQDILDLINTAEMTGKRIFSVGEAHTKWSTDKVAAPGLKLGFPSLDSVIAPGIRPGNVVIPMAKTGVGKTVLLANLNYNLRAHRVLHVTLENTVTEFYELLHRIHRFWNPLAGEASAATLMPNLRITDENRLTDDDLELMIAEYAEEVGDKPEVVMIDYLGYFARAAKGNSAYEKTSTAVMSLKGMAKRHDVAIICPSQVGRGASEGTTFTADKARDSGVVEETGDFVFSFFRPHEAADQANAIAPGASRPEVNLQILKSRRGGKGKIAKLAMSPASLAIVDMADARSSARIAQEVEAYNRGVSYEEIYATSVQVASRKAQMSMGGF